MRALCLGDVFGKPGRLVLAHALPRLRERLRVDFVVANAENAAAGVGLTPETARELLALPIDVLTSGNHVWKYREVLPLLDREPRVLRPANYPAGAPGRGHGLFRAADGTAVGVVNLAGRVFMEPIDSPFERARAVVDELARDARVILVDMHAEATSEKRALGFFLDGRASAVFGTHTHVPTADEEILPGGTAYISDLGMTGPYASVIGMRKEEVLQRFLTGRPAAYACASDDVRICGALFDIGEDGRARGVERVCERTDRG
jgi:metallophosphoesterase (TIGR00282 family)